MKNGWAVVCAAALVGCGPAIELGERPLFSNGTNTLTFLAYDAFTGAPVETATLKVQVGAYTLDAKQSGNAYVVSQVPFGTHLANIQAEGYLAFQGQPSADCSGTLSNPASQCFKTYQVALYPSTRVQDDIVVKAFESEEGGAVTSGTVVATLTGASSMVGTAFPNPLPGTFTVRPTTLVAELDAAGTATLPKDQLVLGGTYSIDVFAARSASGSFLTPAENHTIVAGKAFPQLTLFMGPPALDPVALTVNNEKDGVYDSLVVTFPFPVEVCSEDEDHGWYVRNGGSDGNGDGVWATPDADNPVSVSVSADGGRVSLTANFAKVGGVTSFQPTDGLLEVYFTGVRLRVRGAANCTHLDDVELRDAAWVSPWVRLAEDTP